MGCCVGREKDIERIKIDFRETVVEKEKEDSKYVPAAFISAKDEVDNIVQPEAATLNFNQSNNVMPNKDKPSEPIEVEIEIPKEKIPEKPRMPKKPILVSFNIKIYIEALEISYKFCDEFGLFFRPYLQFFFYDQLETIKIFNKLTNHNLHYEDLNKSAEIIENLSFGSKFSEKKVIINGKENSYSFKSEITFIGKESLFFNSVQIFVKNEMDNLNPDVKLEPIIIGQARIPINLIENNDKNRIFDGLVEIKMRNITPIGHLKLIIEIEEISGDINKLIDMRKVSNDIEDSPSKCLLRNNDSMIFNRLVIHFYEMDPAILDKFFFSNKDTYEKKSKQFQDANKIISDKNIDGKKLQKLYLLALKENNYITIYEIFNLLLLFTLSEDFSKIQEFFIMSLADIEFFFNLCHLINFNPYIIKVYLSFVYQLHIIYKRNKALIYKDNNFYNEELILEINFKLMKKILEILKSNSINLEYALELRECVIWIINNINELINQSSIKNEDYKLAKEELPLSQKKKDYTMIYNNCILLMGYRFTLMKIIDFYNDDSLIMNGIFRVFRKSCQIIANEGSNFLDKNFLKQTPKEISNTFKKLLVEKYDGMFINSLRLMLMKYQHYPELHFNILIILFQIIDNLDNKNLFFTMVKLNLDEFKENLKYFRGNIRAIFKLINSLHLKILAVFSEIILSEKELTNTDETLEEFFVVVFKIFADIRSFYRYEPHQEHILKDFIERKYSEIEIHETITRIICNLSVNKQISSLFWEEHIIVEDLINYIIRISHNKNDFIKNTIQKERKNKNVEEIKKIILSISENTLNILYNLLNGIKKSDKPPQFINFVENLNNKYGSRDDILKILENVTKTLSFNNLNVVKCDTMIREIEKNLSKHS